MRLFLLFLNLDLVFGQNVPAYWTGQSSVLFNGTMFDSTPIKISANSFAYNKFNSKEDKRLIKFLGSNGTLEEFPPEQVNPSNDVSNENRTGKFHKITLTKGYILDLEVMDEFNFNGNNTVPVRLATSWLQSDLGTNGHPGDISHAVQDGHILNLTMDMAWQTFNKEVSNAINKDRWWEIDEYLCYYQGTETRLINGKCVIPYPQIIDYYKSLWVPSEEDALPPLVNGKRSRVTNDQFLVDNPPCFDDGTFGEPSFEELKKKEREKDDDEEKRVLKCEVFEEVIFVEDEKMILLSESAWYMFDSQTAATGWSVNTTFGFNHTTKMFNFNFTILFNNWTIDFPAGLLDNYRDGSFRFDEFELVVWLWIEDPVVKADRPIPVEFYFMVVITTMVGAVLLLTIVFRLVNRTGRAFSPGVWRYYLRIRGKKEQKSVISRNATYNGTITNKYVNNDPLIY